MKSKLLLSVAALSTTLLTGCGMDYYAANGNPNPPVNAVAVSPMQAKVDARIMGGLIVLNQNEIAAANLAQSKSANPAVRNYANMMYNAHSQNLQATQNLSRQLGIMPENGRVAMMLQSKGRHEMAMLHRLNNGAFDKAYINAMVKGHAEALHIIDQKLLPDTTNPALRRHLEMTRSHVMNHLQQARAIQKQLG